MKKKKLFISSLLMLMGVGMAHGQTAYTYVQQNSAVVTADGGAAYDISSQDATMEFVTEGEVTYAVMKIGGNTVAKLPIDANGGELVSQPATSAPTVSGITTFGSITQTIKGKGLATFYSPFQVQPASSTDVTVYAPAYESGKVKLTSSNAVGTSGVVSPGTALMLKGEQNKTIQMNFVTGSPTVTSSGLQGTALAVDAPSETGKTLYTLGYKGDVASADFAFYAYNGSSKLAAGKGYLFVTTVSGAKVGLSFSDDDVTAISLLSAINSKQKDGKYIENGRVVIVKNNKKYNTNGQEVE